jgi:hypothetical protein
MPIEFTTTQLKDTLRQGPYTWPGGYPKYLITDDCEGLCFKCAQAEFRTILESTKYSQGDGWQIIGVGINWEDDQLVCVYCDEHIESAYGEPIEIS